jgi:hypothetical protein
LAGFKTITADQMNQTQTKIRGNVSRMLDFLDKCLGQPDSPNHDMTKIHVYEMYSVFTHAVEEYGKLLYVKSLIPDTNGNYEVNYRYKFRDHVTKFNLALADLPDSIKVIFHAQFDESNFDSTNNATEETVPNWDNRLNVLNVDLDDNNNPTDITFDVDIDILRKCVFDFRNYII